MSWLSKLNSQVDGLLNKDDKKAQNGPPDGQRGYDYQPPPQQYGYQNQSPQPYQQLYGAPPPQQQYGAPQPSYNTHPYASPPPQQPYAPPQPYAAPQQSGGVPPVPSLPPGWTALWDPQGARWAYLEQWNNLVSWTFPTGPSSGGAAGYDASRGYGTGGLGGQPPMGYDQANVAKPKDDSKKNMIMGAAAGVAVGAVGGMVLANALDDDDDHRNNGGYGGGYPPQDQYPPMGAPLPDETRSGSSVSSSDREEVEEARREYEEAYEEAYD